MHVAGWVWPAALVLLVLVFYWAPLTAPSAGIQWDAADLHYPQQKYFSDNIRAAHLPFWTPYVYSGYPFLAYPRNGRLVCSAVAVLSAWHHSALHTVELALHAASRWGPSRFCLASNLPVIPTGPAWNTGVVVPPGDQVLEMRYRSTYFLAGALIMLASLLTAGVLLLRTRNC